MRPWGVPRPSQTCGCVDVGRVVLGKGREQRPQPETRAGPLQDLTVRKKPKTLSHWEVIKRRKTAKVYSNIIMILMILLIMLMRLNTY